MPPKTHFVIWAHAPFQRHLLQYFPTQHPNFWYRAWVPERHDLWRSGLSMHGLAPLCNLSNNLIEVSTFE